MDLPCQFGRYRLVRRLGQGGMAEVFLAVAPGASGFEKRVALKILRPELEGAGEYERLLIEEARLGARLSHRNLVGVHELGVVDGRYYVRLDLVDGADLATLLARASLPATLAPYVAAEVALALDAVHGAVDDEGRPLGLVHRDVSAGNVLVSRCGEVRLGDFGVAKATALQDVTRAGVRKGTYAYMSPEQAGGRPLTAASDQFGLGVLLVELLTGRRPFDGATVVDTLDRVREAAPPALDEVPPPLRAVVLRGLARDPASRFTSAAALHGALTRVLFTGPPVGAPDLGAWVRGLLP